MKFKILSHACVLVQTETTSIVMDPWLLGSCYWRSWWNFPEADFDAEEISAVDAVLISHVHWDHWHGPTLKKLLKGKPVYVPDEPGLRSERDLRSIGVGEVYRVPHGQSVSIGDITVTMYQFGLFLNDAAIVVEAGGVSLLNANDAKIAGWALAHIVARHGRFKFALRSHSSANPRACIRREDIPDYVADDREHYFRSFAAFMNRVNPEYAVPFASNHCHLHDDVFELNGVISNPLQLRDYLQALPGSRAWRLQVMLPGSQWSSQIGFALRDESCFADLKTSLNDYRKRVASTLDTYRRQENAVVISQTHFTRFAAMLKGWPRRLDGILRISVYWPDGRGETAQIDLGTREVLNIPFVRHSQRGLPVILMPAIVFRDAVLKNMFHHAGISKRCQFLAMSAEDMARIHAVMSVLEKTELGFLPLDRRYLGRLAKSYVLRWRELFVYMQALWLTRVRRLPLYLAEEAILKR
jgi:UDP-MurNAc hydroxylase